MTARGARALAVALGSISVGCGTILGIDPLGFGDATTPMDVAANFGDGAVGDSAADRAETDGSLAPDASLDSSAIPEAADDPVTQAETASDGTIPGVVAADAVPPDATADVAPDTAEPPPACLSNGMVCPRNDAALCCGLGCTLSAPPKCCSGVNVPGTITAECCSTVCQPGGHCS